MLASPSRYADVPCSKKKPFKAVGYASKRWASGLQGVPKLNNQLLYVLH